MRRPFALISLLALGWLLLLPTAAFAAAETASADASNEATTQIVTFSEHEHVWDVAVSPDGEQLCYYVSYPVVNVWDVIVYYLPELFLLPASILFLFLISRFYRAIRNRHRAGEPCCKRCGYQLTGVTNEACPECGTTLTGKTIIVPKPLNAANVTKWLLLIALPPFIAVSILKGDPPREGVMNDWFDWHSQTVAEFGEAQKWEVVHERTLVRFEVRVTSTATLDQVEQIIGRSNPHSVEFAVQRLPHDLAMGGDGRIFVWHVLELQHPAINVLDPSQPASEQRADLNGLPNLDNPTPAVVTPIDVVYVDGFNNLAGFEIDSLDRVAPNCDVIRQNRAPTNPDEPPYTQVWDVEDGRRRLHVFGDRYFDSTALVVGKDGRFLYAAMGEGVLEKWDLEAHDLVGEIGRREGELFFQIARSPDGGTLYVAASKDTGLREDIEVHTFDLAGGEWRDTFDAGGIVTPYRFIATGDGRRLVVFGKDANDQWRIVVITLP